MAEEPPNDGDRPEHRPLPSVDVALLPGERRAAKVRTTATIGILSLLGLCAVTLLLGPRLVSLLQGAEPAAVSPGDPWPSEGGEAVTGQASPVPVPAQPEPTMAPQPAAPAPEPGPGPQNTPLVAVVEGIEPMGGEPGTDGLVRSGRRFGQARGFRDAVRKGGASPEEADALVAALDKYVDFRRCRPQDQLGFERDQDGQLVGFEYKVSTTEVYRAVAKASGGFEGLKVEVPVERRRLARGGQVAGSLGQALDGLGLRSSLAGLFVEVFEGKISFKKDTRSGDLFRLILDEEYVAGERMGYGTVHAVEYTGERVGTLRAYWFESRKTKGDFYDKNGRAMHGGWLRTPLRYDHISSGYNLRRRHPVLKRIVPHHGIDYAAASGTPIWAAADGVVSFAGPRGPNGNLIALKHASGYETFYAHLLRINRGIKKGAKVNQRQPIGAVGSTGRSTGPHLHFALKRHGRFQDPASQLNGPGKPLPSALMPRFKRTIKEMDRELKAVPLAAAPSAAAPQAAGPSEVFHEESLDL